MTTSPLSRWAWTPLGILLSSSRHSEGRLRGLGIQLVSVRECHHGSVLPHAMCMCSPAEIDLGQWPSCARALAGALVHLPELGDDSIDVHLHLPPRVVRRASESLDYQSSGHRAAYIHMHARRPRNWNCCHDFRLVLVSKPCKTGNLPSPSACPGSTRSVGEVL